MKYDFDPVPLSAPDPMGREEMLLRATQHYEFVSRRRTVRHFSSESIPRDVIQACILTAGSAPSGANHQPWHFVCVSDPHIKQQIRRAAEAEERAFYGGKAGEQWLEDLQGLGTDAQKPFLETAPWLIAVFAERYSLDPSGVKQKNYYVPESVGIATGLLITALHNVGLATLTHTPNPMKFLNEVLGRSSNERPFLILVTGYPEKGVTVPDIERRSLEEICTFY